MRHSPLAYFVLVFGTFTTVMTCMEYAGYVGAWAGGLLFLLAWLVAVRVEEKR